MPRLPHVSFLLPFLVACATDRPATAPAPRVQSETPTPPASAAPTPATPTASAAQDGDDQGLSIWRDAKFREQFAASYLSETELEPHLTDEEREVMQQVLTLRGNNELDKAVELVAQKTGPAASALFDLTLGKLLLEKERLFQAAAACEKAVEKFPKFRRAWQDLGLIRFREAEFRTAAQAFVRVIELGGGNATTYGLLGFSHASGDDHVAAESAYRMATLLDPATIDWRMGLARAFFKQRRYAEAASLLGALIGKQPDRSELWVLQAQAFLGMNEPRKAAENLELVDRLGQSTAESLNTLGDVYVNDELYDLAVGAYERALDKDGKASPERALRAANTLVRRNANTETHRLLDRIDAVHGARLDDAAKKDVLRLRARLAVATGAGAEEAKVLEQIVAMDPLDGEALIKLGQFHARSGNTEDAVFRYERAAAIPAFEADAKVRHAQLLVGQNKYAAALPLLRRAQALKPRDNIQQYLEQVERAAQARQ